MRLSYEKLNKQIYCQICCLLFFIYLSLASYFDQKKCFVVRGLPVSFCSPLCMNYLLILWLVQFMTYYSYEHWDPQLENIFNSWCHLTVLQILDDPSPIPAKYVNVYSPEFCSFISACLQKDADARPTCEQVYWGIISYIKFWGKYFRSCLMDGFSHNTEVYCGGSRLAFACRQKFSTMLVIALYFFPLTFETFCSFCLILSSIDTREQVWTCPLILKVLMIQQKYYGK